MLALREQVAFSPAGELPATATAEYARLLHSKQKVWWKRLLPVQAPYQWHLRRLKLGRTLEIGCGIGRNLKTLGPHSIGIDHNPVAARIARADGFTALDGDQWARSPLRRTESFDSILVAHVLEHLDEAGAQALLAEYLPYLKVGGRVVMICPQEVGQASDPTHVEFFDGAKLVRLAMRLGLHPDHPYSFPFPRAAGRYFIYNESCLVARKTG